MLPDILFSPEPVPAFSLTPLRPDPELTTETTLRIEGRAQRDISVDGCVCVLPDASVYGTISATTIQVSGSVKGTLRAQEKIVLHPTATLQGRFEAPTVQINAGGQFVGMEPERSDDLVEALLQERRRQSSKPSLDPIPPGQPPEDLSLLDAQYQQLPRRDESSWRSYTTTTY